MPAWTRCPSCDDRMLVTIRLVRVSGPACLVQSEDGPFGTDQVFDLAWHDEHDREQLGFGLRCLACGSTRLLEQPDSHDSEALRSVRWDMSDEGLELWFGPRPWRVAPSGLPSVEDALSVDLDQLGEEYGLLLSTLREAELAVHDPAVSLLPLLDAHEESIHGERVLAWRLELDSSWREGARRGRN